MSHRATKVFRKGLIAVHVLRKGQSKPCYSVTAYRLYRDGEQWKRSSRFGTDAIPLLRLALDEAYAWILGQQASGSSTPAAEPATQKGTRPYGNAHSEAGGSEA